jgi:peptidoglycan/xylan/chitin deacetylase (PgdA/CDA1 family)
VTRRPRWARALGAALLAAALAASPAGAAPAPEWAGVPVLMYHKVDAEVPADAVGRDLTVAPESFEAQLRYLREHRIRTMTAAELVDELARGRRPRDAVVLTFDDGYEDAATAALPLLEKYGARGTFYVSSGFVGTPRHLTWREMRALRDAGNEVACHGTFHLDLSTLDRAGQLAEAGGCMRRFAHYLGRAPSTYAYPAGKYDAVTLDLMRTLGLRAAFREGGGWVRDLTAPYALPRVRVSRDTTPAGFAALVRP